MAGLDSHLRPDHVFVDVWGKQWCGRQKSRVHGGHDGSSYGTDAYDGYVGGREELQGNGEDGACLAALVRGGQSIGGRVPVWEKDRWGFELFLFWNRKKSVYSWKWTVPTGRCSHGTHQHGGDAQHQAEACRGEAGHLSLGVRWGGQDSLVERLVGQAAQSLSKRHNPGAMTGNSLYRGTTWSGNTDMTLLLLYAAPTVIIT